MITTPPLEYVTRAQWGARPPAKEWRWDSANPSEGYLHHTVGAPGGAAYMRQMQAQHQAQGWTDIAYHDVLDPTTLIVYEGTPVGARPAAQRGHNIGTYALCIMGDFRTRNTTTELEVAIALWWKWRHANTNAPTTITGGHKDAPGQATTCPGQHLTAAIPRIRNLIKERPMPTDHITADRIDAHGDRPGLDAWAVPDFERYLELGVFTKDTKPDAVITSERLGAILGRFEAHLRRTP